MRKKSYIADFETKQSAKKSSINEHDGHSKM